MLVGYKRQAIYNAGNNFNGVFLTMEADFFEKCWRVCTFGGFLFSREVLKVMQANGTGTLIFTGASASMRGKPFFAPFTAAKAGLRAKAQSLARGLQQQGIHGAHVVRDGGIAGDKIIKGLPKFAEMAGEDGLIGLQGIADAYLYTFSRWLEMDRVDTRGLKAVLAHRARMAQRPAVQAVLAAEGIPYIGDH